MTMQDGTFYRAVAAAKNGAYAATLQRPLAGSVVALKPVDASPETATMLTGWRTQNPDAHLTKFAATPQRTLGWLHEQVVENRGRILFLITFGGASVGHIGLTDYDASNNSAHMADTMRGVAAGPRPVMEAAARMLISWAFEETGIDSLWTGVFSDNYRAINFFERCMMLTVGSAPMSRHDTEDGWYWAEADDDAAALSQRHHNTMQLTSERFNGLAAGWFDQLVEGVHH